MTYIRTVVLNNKTQNYIPQKSNSERDTTHFFAWLPARMVLI